MKCFDGDAAPDGDMNIDTVLHLEFDSDVVVRLVNSRYGPAHVLCQIAKLAEKNVSF